MYRPLQFHKKNNHFTHEQEKQEVAKGGGHTR